MTEEELRSFKRQLEGAQRAAAGRGEVVYGYHWRDGRLNAMTQLARRPLPPEPIQQAEGRRARRGAMAFATEQGNLL